MLNQLIVVFAEMVQLLLSLAQLLLQGLLPMQFLHPLLNIIDAELIYLFFTVPIQHFLELLHMLVHLDDQLIIFTLLYL